MKKARIARDRHECATCELPILPGEVYLDETKRDRYNPTRFDQTRTCAACVKRKAEEAEDFRARDEAALNAEPPNQGASRWTGEAHGD